jgi:hypothetical protein
MTDHSHPHAAETRNAPHRQHAHQHGHGHDHHHHGQPDAPPVNLTPRATFFALSAIQRLGYAMPLIALLWLGLFWAMQAGG